MTTLSPPRVRDLTSREYAGFQQLVSDASGIVLTPAKQQLLVGRIARVVRERGYATYGEYLDVIRADGNGAELVQLIDLVATNETRFFRERVHYRYLTEECLPAWKEAARQGARPRVVRVWSAACSTGQEPWSVAMTLLDHLPAADGWSVEIVASDISTRALGIAAQAIYAVEQAREIPDAYLRRFMRRGVAGQEGWIRVGEELRRVVRFSRINLVAEILDVPGQFDLVFCSNALIYFSRADRSRVLARLAHRLAPDGRLFVGHAESIHEHRDLLRGVAPTVYAPVTDPSSGIAP